ncbi:hypothetical protein LNO92_04850 [Klebsiella variicola subsp. variicola]|nr:hypothetical protein [Klebsiella variicola subsp. variicola]
MQSIIPGNDFLLINVSFSAVAAVKASCNCFILLFNAACSFAMDVSVAGVAVSCFFNCWIILSFCAIVACWLAILFATVRYWPSFFYCPRSGERLTLALLWPQSFSLLALELAGVCCWA